MTAHSRPPPATEPGSAPQALRLGFTELAGFPSTVAGFVDPRHTSREVVSLLIAPGTGIYATDPGRITVSALTLADWLGFDDRARLLQAVERVALGQGLRLDAFEGLNAVVWLVERRVRPEDAETIERAVPGVVAAFRALVRHVGEQAERSPAGMH